MKFGMRRGVLCLAGLAVVFCVASPAGHCATLRIWSDIAESGDTVLIPVELKLDGGAAPAAIAFDINFGAAPFTIDEVQAGNAALVANKSVSYRVYSGGVHILVGGVNEESLINGELVRVSTKVKPGWAFSNTYALKGAAGSAADIGALRVPLAFENGEIIVQAGKVPAVGAGTLLGILIVLFVCPPRWRKRSLFGGALLLILIFGGYCGAYALVAGDVDESGAVTQDDLSIVADVILGGSSAHDTDIDADSMTDAVDYQLLVRALLGHSIDGDGDGLADAAEPRLGTDPTKTDSDNDGLNDGDELRAHHTDPNDPDMDSDGLSDGEEINTHGTDPNDPDSDNDGLTDGEEVNTWHTGPNVADSDNDGLSDEDEVLLLDTNPNSGDSDSDGIADGDELNTYFTNPNKPDSDNDGLTDSDEINVYNTNPIEPDSDNDGLTDAAELNTHNTDPNNGDTDGDGLSDGDEIANGTNPNGATVNLKITEFLAANNTILQDEDGNFSDWIEIHNEGTTAVNLDGWALSDNENAPAMWVFPAITLEPGNYLVVFASGLDRKPTGGGNLHTNFGLSKGGEFLGLFTPNGDVFDAYTPEYPDQEDDISYGLFAGAPRYFSTPTPGADNNAGFLGYVEAPETSVPHGFHDTPFDVALTSATAGAEIHYTLDGSVPTASSAVYGVANPVAISGTTVLRAAAFKPGYQDSEVTTQTYIFLDGVINQPVLPAGFPATWGGPPSSNILLNGDYEMDPDVTADPAYAPHMRDALTQIPTVVVSMPIADWFSPETGIISNSARNDASGWDRNCAAELIYPSGAEGFAIDCGIRVVGGTSPDSNFKSMKHSFRLKFRAQDGPARLETAAPLFPGSRHTSFNTLVLDARINMTWTHSGPSTIYQKEHGQYLRDQYINDMQSAMDEPSPHGFYAHVYLNGVYWGMYCVHERPDDAFVADYHGGNPEDYDVMKHNQNDVLSGSNAAYKAMFTLARSGMADQAAYDSLASQYLDVDPFINYMLLNYWAGNTDWDHHNWYAARNHVSGSGFRYYSWDAEHVLKRDNDNRTNTVNSNSPTELHNLLENNTEYRIRFGDRAHKLLANGGLFTGGPAGARYSLRADEISDAIIGESARWGDNRRDHRGESGASLYTRDDFWIPERDRILNSYLPNRAGTAINQLRSKGWYPSTDAPLFNINGVYQHGGTITAGAALTMDNPNGTGAIYYTLDGADPRKPPVSGVTSELIPENAAKRVLVPTGDIGTEWRDLSGFDDSGWMSGTGGVGYETGNGYEAFIGIDTQAEMYTINGTCYVRIPFTVDAGTLASLASLTLKVRYDDGFALYLNGNATPVAAENNPASPVWNSNATGTHSDSAAVNFVDYDLTAELPNLQAGANFLAVQVMNSPAASSDLLFSCVLEGNTAPSGPSTSASAQNYGSNPPAALADTTRVRARVYDNGEWSALNDAVYQIDTANPGALRVTEIMYNPAPPTVPGIWGNDDFEYIEIKNTGSETLDLSGVSFVDGVFFTFNDSAIKDAQLLAPGAYLVIVENEAAFRSRYGDAIPIAGTYDGNLDNNGERIRLENADGTPIVEFSYSDNWYFTTDGEGFSLAAADENAAAAAWDDKAAWRPSAGIGGDPGAADVAAAPAPGSIVINEVLAHSHAAAADWIELHNTTGGAIDISGWLLSDKANALGKYVIPGGVSIPANGYIVFYEDLHFGAGNPGTPFALSENGDSVYLASAAGGVLTGYAGEESFGASETGVSLGRYFKASTGTYNFVPMAANTPGAANSAPLVGPAVISEIMYQPVDVPPGNAAAEYIELHNISGGLISFQDASTLATWRIEGGISFQFPPGTSLPADGRLVLVQDLAAFNAAYPGVSSPVLQWDSGKLNNGGEQIQLSKPGDIDEFGVRQYIRIDRVTYDDVAPWPITPAGGGDALQRKVDSDYGNDPANWQAAAPTPGL